MGFKMKMLSSAAILAAGIATLPIEAMAKDMTIGFSSVGRFSLAFIAGETYLGRFAEERGWKYLSAIAENDAAKQSQDIDNLIARGVDAVIVMAVDSKAIESSVRAAHSEGIPVIGYMRPQDPGSTHLYDGFAGQDTVAQAYDAAIEMSKMLDEDSVAASDVKVLHVIGDPKDENALKRAEGFKKAAEEKGWEIVSEIICDGWSLDMALTGATNALESDSSINAVLLASDYLWPGVRTALQNRDKLHKRGEEGHVYIASQDVFPVAVDSIKEGYMDTSTLLDMYGMAVTAMDMTERLLAGEEFSETTTPKKVNWMSGVTITADNVETQEGLWGAEFHPDKK
ncbi:sugar ABC transporter substrate-binding protein [Aliiruegeria sabulilitoris]|uniref:sugar ABC transporter substrate-binding protein n=1 Tax=Aliiruegeria sabulilitoris TaxID=1510458 RepID=UPI0008308377|nr:sugar ABC transporter substrate-binding protein [Aliiruegeria sabulilitoris]NDR55431.1 sugar ABC transporter substrate-binding protein [Pseudoruegeria sp. M32A2M]